MKVPHCKEMETLAGNDILVIDDNPGIRQLLTEFFSKAGFNVRTAANGSEAIQMVVDLKPAIVLLDLIIPGLSSIETLEQLEALSSEIKIIVMSAYTRKNELFTAVQAGRIKHYILKPFDLNELLDFVMTQLGDLSVG